jgi:O-acetyl-ADP-ribose deacetylase (regulator of RNase III)
VKVSINKSTLVLVEGDITKEETEALVNAANDRLAGGGGVDGAIHRAGGPQIMAECRIIGCCPTGQAVITTAGNLNARFVIHAVGPIYTGGARHEPQLLAGAYRESLRLASRYGLKSLSFPSLSTGAYGYPVEEAAEIALTTVISYLREHQEINAVRFVLFSRAAFDVYCKVLSRLVEQGADKGGRVEFP